jgi:broad specificity phosphatase PhoE
MSRIALIRHGQTTWSATGQHTSITELDLTEEGVEQAVAISTVLTGLHLEPVTVFSSPRLRAQRTAQLAGLTVTETLNDLAEWNYGEYEGLTSKQIHVNRPGWNIFENGAPGGETPDQVSARADRALARAAQALEHGDVALVCHGHMSRVLAVRWVGLPVIEGSLLMMNPAAVTVLGTYHGRNCIDHSNVVPFHLLVRPGTYAPNPAAVAGSDV